MWSTTVTTRLETTTVTKSKDMARMEVGLSYEALRKAFNPNAKSVLIAYSI
jgi:hypothetical protein